MGHEPNIIPNITLLIQLGIFFATYFVLSFFVFKPYLKLFKIREEKTSGLMNRARDARVEADRLKNEYENFMQQERKRTATWADEMRRDIAKEERQILNHARREANEALNLVRQGIQQDVEKANTELSPMITEFSSEIASHLLGYEVTVSQGKVKQTSSTEPEQPAGL